MGEQSVFDFIMEQIVITRSEFAAAMQSGDDQEKEEALARMEDAGGYDNLPD